MIQTLIVDDEENIRSFISETLENVGHVTSQAISGEEALAVLRDQFFDLVVLDLNLGGKVNGLRVLEAIRWRWPKLRRSSLQVMVRWNLPCKLSAKVWIFTF